MAASSSSRAEREWQRRSEKKTRGEGRGSTQEQGKKKTEPRITYRLGPNDGLAAGLGAHARKRAEGVVRQHVDAAVVGLEVVDLLLEDEGPEVLAEELDDVERVVEARPVAREAASRGESRVSAHQEH